MKQKNYATIDRAFKSYKYNISALKKSTFPYISGVDYARPKVTGDCYKNTNEQLIISCLEKKEDIEKKIKLVDETFRFFEIEGFGRERYITYRFFKNFTNVRACIEIGIDERTGKRWKRDIYEKAEFIGERMGLL